MTKKDALVLIEAAHEQRFERKTTKVTCGGPVFAGERQLAAPPCRLFHVSIGVIFYTGKKIRYVCHDTKGMYAIFGKIG